ncbi:hypothetical protein WAK64_07085 [Bacillus spongiae]|uniref:Uncharacterized protein n=1 Tax=Bacillus spongiae TaxID=2683610 RepID=A0ABU8HCD7_9BACI
MEKKIIIGILSATLVTGGLGGIAYNKYVQAVEVEKLELQQKEHLEKAKSSVLGLYSEDKNALSESITSELILEAEKLVIKVEKKSDREQLQQEIENVQTMFDTQNSIFSLLKDNKLVDNITKEQLNEVSIQIEEVKSINETFYQTLKKYFDLANTQYTDLIATTEKIKELEQSPDRTTYKEVEKLVSKVLNESQKSELIERVAKVDSILTEQEEEAKRIAQAAKEAEERAKQEASVSVASSNNQTSASSEKSSTSNNTTNEKSSSKDTTSSKQPSENNTPSNKEANNKSSETVSSESNSSIESDPYASDRDWDVVVVGEYLDNSEWTYALSESITSDLILEVEKLVIKVENKSDSGQLQQEIENVQTMFDTQNSISSLLKDNILVDNITKEQLNEVSIQIEEVKSINETFYQTLKKYFDLANTQYTDLIATTEKITELEQSPDRTTYKEVEQLVSKVLNESQKSKLLERVAKVDMTLTEQEAEAKRVAQTAKEAEEKGEAEASVSVASSNN